MGLIENLMSRKRELRVGRTQGEPTGRTGRSAAHAVDILPRHKHVFLVIVHFQSKKSSAVKNLTVTSRSKPAKPVIIRCFADDRFQRTSRGNASSSPSMTAPPMVGAGTITLPRPATRAHRDEAGGESTFREEGHGFGVATRARPSIDRGPTVLRTPLQQKSRVSS